MREHSGHEMFAAIREAQDGRGRGLHAFHGAIRCLCIAAEVTHCAHKHKTRSAASDCAAAMLAKVS